LPTLKKGKNSRLKRFFSMYLLESGCVPGEEVFRWGDSQSRCPSQPYGALPSSIQFHEIFYTDLLNGSLEIYRL
jgi:hypothetical protein